MRKDTSDSHNAYLLRRFVSTAVLVATAGWLAAASAASAQNAADPDAVQAPLVSATAIGAPANEASSLRARVEIDTQPVDAQVASAAKASFIVANDTSTEITLVADADITPDVTRYAIATLDDRMLDHQRGRAVGMIMVATTPNGFRGNSVTLWDEIGPPVQTPQPTDAARAQTGNIVTYNRK